MRLPRPPQLLPDDLSLPGLYTATPDWLHRRLRAWLGVSEANCHEWLCPSLGCRCTTPAPLEHAA